MDERTELYGTLDFGGGLHGSLDFGGGLDGSLDFGGASGSYNDDYNMLRNRPSIDGVVLVGDKTLEDLGDSPLTNLEIQAIFDSVFKS